MQRLQRLQRTPQRLERIAASSLQEQPQEAPMLMLESDSLGPMVLRPYDRREALNLKAAADIAGKSESTVRNWCIEFNIGRRVGNGSWQVSHPALLMLLDGDEKALAAYLAGERQASAWRPILSAPS
jgi:hypothetical protein